ncbi:YeeE/YedE thiosulfate transporter family protein [Pyruvatibacter mobilis]|uniref:YeeE/YedE thiosulfate transporter family protein n=1 Tax=Pyruvatibacter mobilis TaxID=1712261 RepID=UPI003BACB393
MSGLTSRAWSPYAAGVLIGLLQIPAFLAIDTALGASSSYVTMAGHLAALFDGGIAERAYFTKYMTGDKYFWQTALVVGIAAGAFLSSGLSGMRRIGFSPIWRTATGSRTLMGRGVMGFAGGFLLLMGARIAGGCTSGHGISGIAQLAVGSTVAVAAMFAGGILVANLFLKRV